jgi:4-aminobutyrate aminotransferase-like enzyme
MQIWRSNPFEELTITRGDGCSVFDAGGNAYLDLTSGTWCSVLGHGHPRWREVVSIQAATLTHLGPPLLCPQIDDALEKLSQIVPADLSHALFLNTGSEAVELAIKMARSATCADELVIIERSYYGATCTALSLSEAGRSLSYLPAPGPIHRLPAPDCLRCPAGLAWPCDSFSCLDPLQELVAAVVRGERRIAAVLYEPVLANAGVIVPPIGYGARLRELTSRCHALLVAEEVTTGMGRTGRWFAVEHEQVVPDILVIGKAIGAGLPVSAVVTTAEVEAACQGKLTHVQSHQNDPFSGAIAATVISIMQEEGLVERAAELGDYLLAGLRRVGEGMPAIRHMRGRGMMAGIELYPEWAEQGIGVASRLLADGFIVSYQPHNAAFRIFPPYVITTDQLDSFFTALQTALAEFLFEEGS